MKKKPRTLAAYLIYQTLHHHQPLDQAMAAVDWSDYTSSDHHFIHHLCYGTVRWYFRLLPILNTLLHKPLTAKNNDIACVLLTGLYQIIFLKTPEYAAISETVNTIKCLQKHGASGLANKILRLFCQQSETILQTVDQYEHQRYAHPQWLYQRIQNDWPTDWLSILEANNEPAPMTLRINPHYHTADHYVSILAEHHIGAHRLSHLPYAVQLEKPQSVHTLPGFKEGWFYIQDAAGQHTAPLLQLQPGLTVLDACAAPGGKTMDILLTEPQLKKLVAIDKSPQRLGKIKENMERLQINQTPIQLIAQDAIDTPLWWDGNLFDRILIDAPCSGSGVIRRHPDIKILRQDADIPIQAATQYTLLTALWPLLQSGGLLVYSTCSVFKQENQNNIHTFLINCPDSTLVHEQQLLPQIHGHDGFYYAVIQKH